MPFQFVSEIPHSPEKTPAVKKVLSLKKGRAKSKPLANGRDRVVPKEGFSRITCDMQRSVAFHSLSAPAIRVLLWALWKNYHQATNGNGEEGKPRFKFTNADAVTELGIGSAKFSRAKEELAEKGFITWVKRGGLKGSNGVCSEYCLSGDWKTWQPPKKNKRAPPLKKTEVKFHVWNR